MFDEKTSQELNYYVYMLLDPQNNKPFYIGKGVNNRVFDHINLALADSEISNAKYEKIREITGRGQNIIHLIVRHGLREKEALQIESSLIDALNHLGYKLSNQQSGHKSIEKGLMTSEEIIRLYNAQPLTEISGDCIIININRRYKRGIGGQSIYEATKETWTIAKQRIPLLKYVLSEYKGLIVEVYEVVEWYEKERGYMPSAKKYGQTKIGYGFNGKVAPDEIRNKYINKSITHTKIKGSASAIRYNL